MWRKLQNPPPHDPFYFWIYRGKPSLITVICMDPRSPNKLIATEYCFLILGDDYQFLFLYFFISLFSFFCYFVNINFYKNYFIIVILFYYYYYFFFYENYFYFFMFRNVPFSGVYRRPSKSRTADYHELPSAKQMLLLKQRIVRWQGISNSKRNLTWSL